LLFLSVASGWDYRYLVLCFRQFQDTVGVVTFISNQVNTYEPGQQRNRRNHIMNAAAGQKYPQRVPTRIDNRVYFAGQTAFGFANRLIEVPPFAPVPA
jgi:hypothetical protein